MLKQKGEKLETRLGQGLKAPLQLCEDPQGPSSVVIVSPSQLMMWIGITKLMTVWHCELLNNTG